MLCPKCGRNNVFNQTIGGSAVPLTKRAWASDHPVVAVILGALQVAKVVTNLVRNRYVCRDCGHTFNHPANDNLAESSADRRAAESERQRLANERAERERQLQARLAHERWVRDQERPAKARAYGVATFLGFVILGVFLGFAGGQAWFLKVDIDDLMTKKGWVVADEPTQTAFRMYIIGRFDKNSLQRSVQDAVWPLILVAAIPLIGGKWDGKNFLLVLLWVSLRGCFWLLSWPATLVVDHISGSWQGAMIMGMTFGAWGAVAGLFVMILYYRNAD